MSFSITDSNVLQFSGAVKFLAQQRRSRLRGTCVEDTVTGEAAYMEQVAPSAAQKRIARHGDSPIMNSLHLRRRLAIYDYEWGDLVDRLDKVMILIDAEGAYTRNAAFALSRAIDDEIIGAMWATAYTGHTGATAVTWPNGNAENTPTMPGGTQVLVNDWTYGNGNGNTGLTISKLVSASVALDQAEGDEDEEDRYGLLNAKRKGNLLATTEATLREFGIAKDDLMPLREGKIARIMGFELRHSERLQQDSNGYDRVPFWRKTALGLGIGRDIAGQVAPRPDKSFATYVYADMAVGASRLEEPKLVEVKCL